ncbi:MAG: HD domain-containing protein, partial [Elusimicrobia bacterium]|nr:HD domain-containing protein [Elusimicrobiota bacterium]
PPAGRLGPAAPALRRRAPALALLRAAARELPRPSYLVGGALRDAWLGRPLLDLDVAVRGARAGAARLARSLGASLVTLDAENGVYRIVPKDRSPLSLDVCELQGADIAADLGRRDFTVNALALELSPDLPAAVPAGAVLDPRGGLGDLRRRLLRCEDEKILESDPLRVLRAFRLGAQLGLTIEAKTMPRLRRLRCRVRRSAPERIAAELSLLLAQPGCPAWLARMDHAGLLTALFEDLEAARQCALCYYGRGGVLRHTLEVCSRLDLLLADPRRAFGAAAGPLLESFGERLAPGRPWRAWLMLAALLHDVSKPETAKRLGGRLRFFGHDLAGARRAAAVLKALRFPNEAAELAAAVAEHHLRPGNLAAGGRLTDKAVYRFFRDLGEDAVPVLLVCWADHASYLPHRRLERLLPAAAADPETFDFSLVRPVEARKTLRHLQVVSALLRRRFDAGRRPVPERILDGHAVMKALGIPPGPEVGRALEKLREAQAEGKVRTKKEALEFLKRAK